MSHILITGGGGLVGLNTARAFAAEGSSVVITARHGHDRIEKELADLRDLVTIEPVELARGGEVLDLFSRYNFHAVIHTAPNVRKVEASPEHPAGYEPLCIGTTTSMRMERFTKPLMEREGVKRLERVFGFRNFTEALRFTNRVGALAEDEGHHPAILTEWGRVTVTLWTHKIRGLHRNDFVMAAKIDYLQEENPGAIA